MVAIPYRAELRAKLVFRVAEILGMAGVAAALIAVAGRLDDFNVRWFDAIWIPAAVLLATALYARLGPRLGEKLAPMRTLGQDARRIAPPPVRWAAGVLYAVGAGLIIGGIALVLDLEVDGLAIVLAVALGGSLGDLVPKLARVARHERARGGTVYRVEDPPGTEAGLAWAPDQRGVASEGLSSVNQSASSSPQAS